MCAWSLATMILMSEHRYRLAWVSSFFSQIGWAVVAYQASLPGMLVFSAVMMFVAGRALWRGGGVSDQTKPARCPATDSGGVRCELPSEHVGRCACPDAVAAFTKKPAPQHLYGCPYFPNHKSDPYFCACDAARAQFAVEDAK